MGRSSIEIVSWLLLLMGVAAISISSASKCIDGERAVLLKFKHNFLDQSSQLLSWGNDNEDCCFGWEGVGCDNLTGHVVKIDLAGIVYLSPNVGYTSIPFIRELSYLNYLDLNDNSQLLANQSISSLIGNNDSNNASMIVSLQHLSIGNTGIVGTFPENFGNNTPSLTHLDISHNRLEGSIPESFGNNTPFLTYLDIIDNALEGSIPENFGNNMPFLTHLDLSWNVLEGSIPENFGNSMPALTHLDISHNILEGSIPESFGNNMPALTHLDISYNALEGSIPESFGNNMPSIMHLDMSWNRLEGSIPESVVNIMPALTHLDLSCNKLEGFIPENFGKGISVQLYTVNPELYGYPLSRSCPGEEPTHPSPHGFNEYMDTLVSIEFYASMEVGYVVGFWGVIVTMLFNRPCRFAYFKFLQHVANWAYVVAASIRQSL